jgi:hypothetical protein
MGDSLEENFVFEEEQPRPVKKPRIREASAKTQLEKELGVTDERVAHNVSEVKTGVALVVTSSMKRLSEISEVADRKNLKLEMHGTGRKQEQLNKMRKDIKSGKFNAIAGVSARIASFVEDGTIEIEKVSLVLIDSTLDAKKFNTLTQPESNKALKEIVNHPRFNGKVALI